MKIQLRKINLSDTVNIVKWRNSEEVRKNLFTQDDLTEEQHINWFHSKVETGLCTQYIIQVINGSELIDIGTTFIKRPAPDSEEGEFGIFIGESEARGKHYALPSTKEMLRIGFENLNLKYIFLTVFADNIPAIKTYKNAGFRIVDEYVYSENTQKKIYKMEIKFEEYLIV